MKLGMRFFGANGFVILAGRLSLRDECRIYLAALSRPTVQLELLAQLHVAEERSQHHYRVHLSQSSHGDSTAAILQTLIADEEWHCDWVKGVLAVQQRKFGRTRVAAVVDYFWSL